MRSMLLILIVAVAFIQAQSQCQICSQVPGCPQELFKDLAVDALYAVIKKQVPSAKPPISISKIQANGQANYTFKWPEKSYLAIVNLSTNAYRVITQKVTQVFQNSLINIQNELGVRNGGLVASPNLLGDTDMMNRIDKDIRNKYFPGQNVKCISIKTVPGGYHAIYLKDGLTIEVDAAVQNNSGNTLISYNLCSQSSVSTSQQQNTVKSANSQVYVDSAPQPYGIATQNPSVNNPGRNDVNLNQNKLPQAQPINSLSQAQTTTQPITSLSQAQTTNLQGQSTTQLPQTQSQSQSQPIIGGYSLISQPLSDKNVQNVIAFLSQSSQIGNIIQSAILISAESQLVNGYNYRLTISLDKSSTAQYVIVAYVTFAGAISITSINLVNAPTTYTFGAALSSSQLSQLSYLKQLISAVSGSLPSDAVLTALYTNYPFFKIVFSSSAYSQIVLIVSYDALSQKLTILSQTSIPITPTPTPIKPTPLPAPIEPTPLPAPIEPTPLPAPINNQNQNSQTSQNLPSGAELACSDIQSATYIQSYIDFLGVKDSSCSRSNLIGIFWQVSNHNFLIFRFKQANGSVKDFSGSIDYIQYTLSNWKNQKNKITINNCLTQVNGLCTKCANKYYVNGGKCAQVQVECSDFDYTINQCIGCYHGYYLDMSNTCQLANYLCETSDRAGNCITCFKDYRLTFKARCVYIAVGVDPRLPQQENNALCSKFTGLQCLSCVQGCYMGKQNICKIPDPNCSTFDKANEICTVCMDSYVLSTSTNSCVPKQRYD